METPNFAVTKFINPKIIARDLEITGYQALALTKTHPYLVILNQYQHPQGLFVSECVDENNGNLTLADLNLRPLPAILAQTTTKEFLDRLCQYDNFATIWAVVDRQNRYLGVIEVLPLIRLMAQDLNNKPLKQFINLIEQLPFPALIYDCEFGSLGANRLWREQFGENPWRGGKLVKSQNQTWQINSTNLSGDLLGLMMAIAQDVTSEQHLTQELADQNAHLIKLNRIKDEFIARINHELKTPLTALIGFSSLLSAESIGSLNDRQKRYVNMILQNGRHLTLMIDTVMDLAKAETGQLELELEILAIQDICQRSINKTQKLLSQNLNQETPAEITLQIDPRAQNIFADGARVQQMLMSLLSNAIKFAEGAPKILVSVQVWEGWIALSVIDHGIGIPEDKQHLIFQKFQQLENIRTRKYDGVGLGLILTRHLARLHGGDISFVSQVGKGSEFTILLPPAAPSPLEPTNPAPLKINQHSNQHFNQLVLVVENIPEDIDHLIAVLDSLNYRVVVARSGTEALEKARKLQPSLIFLNPDLPLLSGRDVLALLKKDPTTAAIKVLMTAKHNTASSLADWQVSKPIRAKDLAFLREIAPPLKLTILNIGGNDIQKLAQDLNYQVLTAFDIAQAEVLAKIWQPQLLLLDYLPTELSTKLTKIGGTTLKNLPILLISEVNHDQEFEQKNQQSLISAKFPQLNLHFLNQPNPQKINKLIPHRTANPQFLQALLCNFASADKLTQPMFQYLLTAGFKPQILENLDELLPWISRQKVDFVLIKLNLDDGQVHCQIQNILAEITIPVIIINEGGANSSSFMYRQKSVPVLHHAQAIALLIPILQQFFIK